MKRETLKVEKRTVLGKKIRNLRREGILPGNIYGKDLKSISIQLPLKEFKEMFRKVHETGLVDLHVDSQVLPVLIHNVQFSPVTQEPIHADFYKVNLKEKITANVPIVAIGEPIAVVDKKGVLLHLLQELEVEALPTELPEKIEVNVENLKEVDDQISVSGIKTGVEVKVINDASQIVFKIGELVSKEAEEQAAEEEAAQAEAKAEAGAEEIAPEKAGEEKKETTEEQPQAQEEAKPETQEEK